MTCGSVDRRLNLLLFCDDDRIDASRIRVCDRRLNHLRTVHRANVGDRLRVGEIDGLMGEAQILEIDQASAVLAVTLDQPPPQKLPLTLVLALPRPKMLRRVLRNAAEFGVERLHLINSYRVEKSYWQTPVLEENTVRQYLLQGLEQSRDTCLPSVIAHRSFRVFAEDILPALTAGKNALVAHPGAAAPCTTEPDKGTVLVIGPEGGLIPYEIKQLEASGCRQVSLGPRILRVENAITYAIGRLF
jgi:RsmE family RNA methyltransferase